MEKSYDQIKKYIDSEIESETRKLIADFAILWNIYERDLFENNYGARKIEHVIKSRLTLSKESDTSIYEIFNDFKKYVNNHIIKENLYFYFNFRNNDMSKEEFDKNYNSSNLKDNFVAMLAIVGRVRNNLFHGLKELKNLDDQQELFIFCNRTLSLVLSNSNCSQYHLFDVNPYTPKWFIDFIDKYSEENSINRDLKNSILNLNDDEIIQFYTKLNIIISGVVNSDNVNIIRMFPKFKPYYYFGTLYYILKDLDVNNSYEQYFKYFEKYLDVRIDIFMIVNYLRYDYHTNVIFSDWNSSE